MVRGRESEARVGWKHWRIRGGADEESGCSLLKVFADAFEMRELGRVEFRFFKPSNNTLSVVAGG